MPITQRRVIIVTFAEPTIIEHEQFDPQSGRFIGHRLNLFSCEIKIGTFPVVDQDRSLRKLMLPADQMLLVERMQRLR